MDVRVLESLADVPAAAWNAVAGDANPFLRHEFLFALERSGCTGGKSGWAAQHLVATDAGRAVGAVPLYRKDHSYGEYVFDWSWANTYAHAGLAYYPKLVAAVPFTPVTGPRLLLLQENTNAGTDRMSPGTGDPASGSEKASPREVNANGARLRAAPDIDRTGVANTLIEAALELTRATRASSLHWLFTHDADTSVLESRGLLRRTGYQFHWSNPGYRDFDDFLSTLTAEKRKKLKRERRAVREAGVTVELVEGTTLNPEDWARFYEFYHTTIREHGAIAYLTREFFPTLGAALPHRTLLALARQESRVVGGALFLRGGRAGAETLYGRYWGATRHVPMLHFEVCYYAPMEYCIAQGIQRFEAGAQGGHKLARGFVPTPTHSAHWLAHPALARAVADYLARERAGVGDEIDELREHVPFRTPQAAPGVTPS
jgi:predicted N-acyltransferase